MRVAGNLLVDHGEQLVEAAAARLGVCQVLDFMVGTLVREGRLVELLRPFAAAGPPIHALCRSERSRSPNVRAFLTFLTDVFRWVGDGAR